MPGAGLASAAQKKPGSDRCRRFRSGSQTGSCRLAKSTRLAFAVEPSTASQGLPLNQEISKSTSCQAQSFERFCHQPYGR
ncbi:hypothetical protein O181_125443 [Austropuccinia psidii MF-1]|uniref:Uncharacterized protein n=1 Tax=Austropuccinia psidii MF-1 TaxID=1389203 RepID=A0A9Q3KQL0_9BASI|nr:hypothetical protein [Austropuccinia psidii MF-1]